VAERIAAAETASLTSAPSDGVGLAEAIRSTVAPNKRGVGGTAPGSYTAAVTGVSAASYNWNGVQTSTVFTLQ
jgi:hypothetical protein